MINNIKDNHPVEIRSTPYGNGLFAIRQIKAGEVALTVCRKYFVVYDDLIKKWPGSVVKDKRAEFAYRLAIELNLSEESTYSEYLSTLPKQDCTPICLSNHSFEEFQNKHFIQHMTGKSTLVSEAYDIIDSFAKEKDYPLITRSQFLYCYSLIQSRTLYFPTPLDPSSQVGAMVPLYDMCNHSEQVNRQNIYKLFYFDKDIDSYVLKAYKYYKTDEQIFISYGSYNNQHFVEFYGFVPDNNKNITELWLNTDRQKDKDMAIKVDLIEMTFPCRLNTYPRTLRNPIQFSINQEGDIFDIDLLWILSLSQESLKKFNKKQLFTRIHNNFQQLCDKQKFRSFVQEMVQQALHEYPTSLEQDKQQLNKPQTINKLLLQYRIAEKQQIKRTLKVLL